MTGVCQMGEVWVPPNAKSSLINEWRTMGGFRDILWGHVDTTALFEKDVVTAVFNKPVCHISYTGECREEDHDLIQKVTVTWPDKTEELWDLRLFRHADGTPVLDERDRLKKATFTEVGAAVRSAPGRGAGKSAIRALRACLERV